jgi:hypothetical protein
MWPEALFSYVRPKPTRTCGAERATARSDDPGDDTRNA